MSIYVRVVVHGTIPAASPQEAIAVLCELIRAGIGPDLDDGREWGVAIAAAAAGDELRVNEEFVRRS